MTKVYISNVSRQSLGGGWSFLRSLRKGLKNKVEFVSGWENCDIVFAFSITTINKREVHDAINSGKKFVFRVDNLPRKSRNPRMSPVERLAEFGNRASAVIYQSKWCRKYAGYFIDSDNEFIVYNGVDVQIFNTKNRRSDGKTYLYLNYNDNPNKRFYEALYWFDLAWRKNKKSHLIIVGNIPEIYLRHPEYNWDLSAQAKVEYLGVLDEAEKVAEIMKKCDYLIFPSFAEAAPNTLIEAMACGVKPIHLCEEGGTMELYNLHKDKPYTIEQMSNRYFDIFNRIL